MSTTLFKRSALAIAGGFLLSCAGAPDVFAQSCYNNSNPNLVLNGGFEDGALGYTIPHWSVKWSGTLSDGSPVDPYVTVDNDNPYDGKQELKLGTTDGANDITQKIKGTRAGTVYTVCFWLYSAPDQAVGHTSFEVLWNDVSQLAMTQSGPSPYQYYTFTITGTGADHLRFRERNDQGYYYLDDVSVELCSGCQLGSRSKIK